MICHHPSDALLIAHAAGRLPVLHARVLAVHLSACKRCHGELQRMIEIGGALLEDLPPIALQPDALSRTMARLGEVPTKPEPAGAPPPVTLTALAVRRWWWLGPGIRLMPLQRRDASDTRLDLIRVAPGTAMPAHGHTGLETSCILQGGYSDETGEYAAYDIAEGDDDLDHAPVAATGPDCICLIATTGRLRGHTWLSRLVQPLIGV
jgi:putative transcriptional regulator